VETGTAKQWWTALSLATTRGSSSNSADLVLVRD
jgi:hypothetical protein